MSTEIKSTFQNKFLISRWFIKYHLFITSILLSIKTPSTCWNYDKACFALNQTNLKLQNVIQQTIQKLTKKLSRNLQVVVPILLLKQSYIINSYMFNLNSTSAKYPLKVIQVIQINYTLHHYWLGTQTK